MKGKLRITLSLALALLLALCLLTACGDTGSDKASDSGGDLADDDGVVGGSDKASDSGGDLADDDGVVGLWESEEWGGICLELLDDGTGTIYTYSDMGDLTYEWDGKTLTLITVDEDDGELEETTGELQADGSIGIMGLGYFFPVEERSYGPDMAGSSFMEAGGMEGELEGDWIHSSGNRMLTFDGSGSVTFHETFEGGSSSSSSGWYSYDGQTVTVDTSAGIAEGYIDSMGDLIIEIDGEGGWYSPGDSSQLTYPDITGPEAELVGEWANSSTGDSVEFTSDGSVVYAIGGSFGVASPFTFDGETVTFSDYTGYIDGDGDLIVEGLDGWFSRTESSSSGGESDSGDSSYSLGGAYDNDDAEVSIVFYSDGTVTISDYNTAQDGIYTVDGDYIYMEMEGAIPYEGWYDASDDTFTVDGLLGEFYAVYDAWYTP